MKPGWIGIYTGNKDDSVSRMIMTIQLPEHCTLEEAAVFFREALIADLDIDHGKIDWP